MRIGEISSSRKEESSEVKEEVAVEVVATASHAKSLVISPRIALTKRDVSLVLAEVVEEREALLESMKMTTLMPGVQITTLNHQLL